MKLSENFTLNEFVRSQTASRRGIDNNPSKKVIENLEYGCKNILEVVRKFAKGKLIIVSSGYRCRKLNRAIGGSPRSQHMVGAAADITMQGKTVRELARLIVESGVPFDQLIIEFERWIHVSWTKYGTPRGKIMIAYKVKNIWGRQKTKYKVINANEI